MIDIEIPLGRRTLKYRLLEMLPAICSYGAFILLIVLSLISPALASIYLLIIITSMLVKAVGIAFHIITGNRSLEAAQKVDWKKRLSDLENPKTSYKILMRTHSKEFGAVTHAENLRLIAADPALFPKPSEIYNAVIIAAYNESYEVIAPTVESVLNTTYDNNHIILTIAYEERGGKDIKTTAERLKKEYGEKFYAFHIVEHPKDIPNEVRGKGGNITYAGKFLKDWLNDKSIQYKNTIVTTLDSDNKPHKAYFDYVTYEYIVHEDRKHLAYQPVSLFLNNIWDAPAPMRVLATGNSFWNIISSMRPHTLRNFASHSQSMDALEEMDFWSTRTIVEDGHQYWRSYFYFNGNYAVLPIYVPIYQDAVLSSTYIKTLKAQFIQLRRWSYGASDVAYVGNLFFSHDRNVTAMGGFSRFFRLLDGHVTQACVPILIAIGGWAPLLLNSQAARSMTAHQLPDVISVIQQIAMIGLVVSIYFSFKMLPPRPERYKRRRTLGMLLQWVLMPVTSIAYGAFSAIYSQSRLLSGRYMDKFDVTEKATHQSVAKTKQLAKGKKMVA
jgi:cellulose synthase/poly-beta-1,6-N-acetylglucosamine synthase-like glycosyltransferase